ncbi:MAG TPA: glycosyltransferase family 2 protein, partial [Candidatus Paceibacterota bacterium]|nr:glycosyltransferase family 2 protein [Candidatus Paceibacterota bacterium]
MSDRPILGINIAVLNGRRYIRHCLDSILTQTYDHGRISVRILDNGSTDGTQEEVAAYLAKMDDFHGVHFTQSTRNYGMWGGQEELMKQGDEPFLIFLSADVVMEERFVEQALATLEKDESIGALQAKVYQAKIENDQWIKSKKIDSCGFQIFRSRKILNIGHGQPETEQLQNSVEVFGVEGAVPVFRREALESIRVLGEIADQDLFWYGEDLDVAWRLRLAGWKEIYEQSVMAWHERGTSKSHGRGHWWNHLSRVKERQL